MDCGCRTWLGEGMLPIDAMMLGGRWDVEKPRPKDRWCPGAGPGRRGRISFHTRCSQACVDKSGECSSSLAGANQEERKKVERCMWCWWWICVSQPHSACRPEQ